MDIVRSLELESFILTKLTKPSVPVNLVGPQVNLPPRWVPASRGSIHFFCVIRRHSRWVRADSGGERFFHEIRWSVRWVPAVRGKRFFREIRWPVRWVPAVRGKRFSVKYWWPVWWVPAVRWRNNYFPCNKEALPCGCRGPSCQPLHVQYSSNGSRSLTTLTTPHREHYGGR